MMQKLNTHEQIGMGFRFIAAQDFFQLKMNSECHTELPKFG